MGPTEACSSRRPRPARPLAGAPAVTKEESDERHAQIETVWLLATLASANIQAAPDAAPRPIVVLVLNNYAAVPAGILNEAARIVTGLSRKLGIDVRWSSPVTQSEKPSDVRLVVIATVHVRIFERETGDGVLRGVLGIDAADAAAPLATAHVLYEPVGDEPSSAAALAYVLAHLVGNAAMGPDAAAASAIVLAGGDEAERLLRGESPFDPQTAERIRDDALLAAASGGHSAR